MPLRAEDGAAPWQSALWQAVADAGYPMALLSEEQGGFDLTPLQALGLVRLAAAQAAPLPLGETMVANWLLAGAGLDPAPGPAGFGSGAHLVRDGAGWRLRAHLPRLPWGRDLGTLALLGRDEDGAAWMARLTGGWTLAEGHNLAAEPRDDLAVDLALEHGALAPAPISPDMALALGALVRAQAMAGAAEAVLALCVDYANMRVQFGRPIGAFQAIQQQLAVMTGEVAATRAGADMAAAALGTPGLGIAAAAAKLRAGEAAGRISAIAHQVHGAIGFTREYRLHPFTRRLWAWRDEYGAESHWADHLGAAVCALGPGGVWPFLTDARGAA